MVTRLVDLIRMVAEGTFVPDRERVELSAAIGTREDGAHCRGKGAIPWKLAWREHIESYKSHKRS
jgi:hypothetical protein